MDKKHSIHFVKVKTKSTSLEKSSKTEYRTQKYTNQTTFKSQLLGFLIGSNDIRRTNGSKKLTPDLDLNIGKTNFWFPCYAGYYVTLLFKVMHAQSGILTSPNKIFRSLKMTHILKNDRN